jgi:hypothetical protein
MSWTTKVLVIANRTVDSEEVRDAITSRAAAGPLHVTLVAPVSSGGGSLRERRAATERRVERAVERLRAAGVTVEGIVGDADPMVAVQEVWDPRRFDEVNVAMLPAGASRWMAADLPSRVERLTGARVTRVVARQARLASMRAVRETSLPRPAPPLLRARRRRGRR